MTAPYANEWARSASVVTAVLLNSLWIDSLLLVALVAIMYRQTALLARTRYATLSLFFTAMIVGPPLVTWLLFRLPNDGPSLALMHGSFGGNNLARTLARFLPFLMLAWMVGGIAKAAAGITGLISLRRLILFAAPVNYEVMSRVQALADSVGLRTCPQVLTSAQVLGPMVIGAVRPILILPAGIDRELTGRQVEALVVHELMHVVRKDGVFNYLQALVEAVLFFNPVVLWTSRRIREEREVCCDECVVQICDRLVYLQALAAVAHRQSSRRMVALAASDGLVLARVKRLAGQIVPAVDHVMRTAMIGVAAGSLGFMFVVPVTNSALRGTGSAALVLNTRQGVEKHGYVKQDDGAQPLEDGPDTPGEPEDDQPASRLLH